MTLTFGCREAIEASLSACSGRRWNWSIEFVSSAASQILSLDGASSQDASSKKTGWNRNPDTPRDAHSFSRRGA